MLQQWILAAVHLLAFVGVLPRASAMRRLNGACAAPWAALETVRVLLFARISLVQLLLMVLMIIAASGMALG